MLIIIINTKTLKNVTMVESGIKSCRYGRIWNKIDLMKHCRYGRLLHEVNHVTMVESGIKSIICHEQILMI